MIAQALMAAYGTVEDRVCHSLHCYFIRPGDPKIPIVFEVDRSRDGIGHWFTNETGKNIAIFSAVFTTVLVFGLIGLDYVIKKPYPSLGWPGYTEFATAYFPGGGQLLPNYVIPIFVMLVLPFVLVQLCIRLFGAGTREWMIAIWTGFVATYLVLTIVGTSMRGPGMDLYAPWALPETHQCFAPSP